jgi:hypothetical protein
MKIIDGDISKIEEVSSEQEKLPHGLSSMILGIVSISICIFYGSGIVVSLITKNQIKKDLPLYTSDPKKYEKSYKMTKVAIITSNAGLYASIGFLITIIIMVILDV